MKLRSRLFLIIIAAAVFLLFIVVAALHTPPVRRYALDRLVDYLRSTRGIEMTADSLDYNLLTLSVELDALVLRSTKAANLPPFLTVDSVRADASILSLISGKPVIEDIQLEGVGVQIVLNSGQDNLPHGPRPSTGMPDLPLPLIIARLDARGRSLEYLNNVHHIRLELHNWMFEMRGDPSNWTQSIRFHLEQPGLLDFQRHPVPLNRLALDMELKAAVLELKGFLLESENSRIRVAGTLEDFDHPEIDSTVTANLSAQSLAEFAGLEQAAEGNIEVHASVSGLPQKIFLSSRISGSDLVFGDIKNVDISAAVDYDRDAGRIRIDPLDVDSQHGSISVQANLSVSEEAGESLAGVQLNDLDLETITGSLLPIRIASRVSGDLNAHWEGTEFEQVKTGAHLRFSATRAQPIHDVLPFSASVFATGAGNRFSLKIDLGQVLDMSVAGDISLAAWRDISGKIQAKTDRMESSMAALEAFLGRKPESLAGTDLNGPLDIDAELGGTLEALRVAAKVDAPATRVGKLSEVGLTASIHYSPQAIIFDSVHAVWKEQTLTVDGEIGLMGERRLNLKAYVNGGSLGAVVAGLGKDLPIDGRFNLKADVGGTVGHIKLLTSVAVSNLTAYGQDLGKLDLWAGLDDSRIELRRFELDQAQPGGAAGRWTITGNYDMESGAYTFQSVATQLRFKDMTIPNGPTLKGKLSLSAQGMGSFEAPSLNAKLDLSEFELGDRLLGSVDLTAQLKQQQAELEVKLPRFNIVSNTGIGIRSPYPASFEVKADTDLSKLQIKLSKGEMLEGSAKAELKGFGELARWQDGEVSLLITDLLMMVRGGEIGSQGPLELNYENRRLTFRRTTLVTGDSNISISGSLPLNPGASPGTLDVTGSLDLSNLLAFMPGQPDLSAGGILQINGILRGSLKKIEPAVKLSMADGFFDHSSLKSKLENINLDADYRNNTATIHTFSASLGPASIRVSGRFPIASLLDNSHEAMSRVANRASFSADVEGLRASDFRKVPDAIAGTVGFHLEGETRRLKEMSDLRMKLLFSQFQFKTSRYEIQQAEPVEISIADGTLTIDRLLLTAPTTRVEVRGTVGLTDGRALDLRSDGNINIGIASLFSEAFRADGDSRFELELSGKLSAPLISGFFEMNQGEFAMQTPDLTASNLNVRLRLNSKGIEIEKFSGSLNGGELQVTGTMGYGKSGIEDMQTDISLKNAYISYPQGFRSRISADLTLRSEDGFVVLGGSAFILEGSYSRQLDIAGKLVGLLQSGNRLKFTGEENPFLSKFRFDVNIDTYGPLLVDNNIAELKANIDVRLTGTYYRPGLIGRVSLEEGGELRFNQKTYLIQRGVISFLNQVKIEPDLDIVATTKASGYDITLSLSGTPDDLKANLTSDPPDLSQADIIAVLLTGRNIEDLRGSGLNVAREQVDSYLSGQVGSFLSSGAEQLLGLSMVRIDPTLISPEANPGARLTVGDDITSSLYLIYSMNLVNPSDQIITAQYDVTRRLQTELTRQSDNSYRFDLRHNLQFGGISDRRKTPVSGTVGKKIGTIDLTGNFAFPRDRLVDKFGQKAGEKYDFFKVQKGLDRLRIFYHKGGYLECRINLKREETERLVDLSLHIVPGPEVDIIYHGWNPSGATRKRVRKLWSEGLFDSQRSQEAIQAIRISLAKKEYLQVKVTSNVSTPSEDKKIVSFEIDHGVRFHDVVVDLEGASEIDPAKVKAALQDEQLNKDIYVEPKKVTSFLQHYYRQNGYLDAVIKEPRYELNSETETGKVVIALQEGPKFKVRRIAFTGNKALTDQDIRSSLPLSEGEDYDPELMRNSADRLQQLYWSRGYNNILVDYKLRRAPEAGELDIEFEITENRQQVVDKIEIEGNMQTSEKLIRSQISLSPGDVLDYREANASRQYLYDTQAYTLVDIQSEPTDKDLTMRADNYEPVVLKVRVSEVRPFKLRYGGFYDTERGLGGIAEFSNHNSLGSARFIGTRIRYDSDVQELRGYFSQPFLRRLPVDTDITGFFRKEFTNGQDTADSGFTTEKTGFTLQQEARFRNKFILNYGYRFQHNRTYDTGPDPSPVETRNTAPLTATLTRDTRNDLLDASRGSFASQAFEYAPSYLGSDLRYFKYLGQYFHYLPLSKPTEIPWAGGKRSRLVVAGALRIGLATGFDGQDLILADKFFAGGGTTIRGFGQNEVGPRDGSGAPIGGNALLIVNGELRFPIFSVFDGVGFLDVGNIYPGIRDFDPTNVRASSGFGLRVRTPYFLLRADYGIKLDRKPGESFGKFFFSIGQAF